MSEQPASPKNASSKMEKIVALCKRKGFIFQSSEIYGGINGFWDYGPLGVELKRNLKDAWYHDIVRCPGIGPDGQILDMVPLDATIIMNPKVWIASGHVGGFSDPMVDCRECKARFRADKVFVVGILSATTESSRMHEASASMEALRLSEIKTTTTPDLRYSIEADSLEAAVEEAQSGLPKHAKKANVERLKKTKTTDELRGTGDGVGFFAVVDGDGHPTLGIVRPLQSQPSNEPRPCPKCGEKNTLTEARQFNLMFESFAGAVQDETSKVYLRPETAQGIFVNFRNVVDTSRVKVPFGIAQIGKAFRNEVTPRNFTFRSREFEQMEIEFFIRPDTANEWYKYWRDARFAWWQSIGLTSANLQLREHDKDELAHYAKEGAGTSDIEYKFPFTDPGFGELEGIAHRSDFDLKAHAQHSGLGDKLKYFDQELQLKLQAQGLSKEAMENQIKYFPHVIEPSAGADRGTLALLCEAYTDDPSRPSGVVMKFHPRMAPIKAAIFPLVDKDGMPEIAEKLYMDLRKTWNVQVDNKQNIGKRYARMDEAGTPFCFTIDTQTLQDQTVTVRHRDTLQQERLNLSQVHSFLAEKMV